MGSLGNPGADPKSHLGAAEQGEPLVPDFLIAGAPRSGTTALATAIDGHPQVSMAKPLIPEPKVFTGPPGEDGYLAHYRRFFGPGDAGLVRGEKTSNYMESAQAREAIRRELPGVKIIFTVREPVSRAYSNWLWSRSNGLEELSFADALAAEGSRRDPLPDRPNARPFDYVSRGDYGAFARGWYEDFGREQVAFFLYEELTGERASATLGRLQEFLALDPHRLERLPSGIGNEAKDTGPPIEPDDRERLRRRMQPLVEDFGEISGLDLSAWGY